MKVYRAVLADNPRRVIILPRPMNRREANYVANGKKPNYPVPAVRRDIVYWNCGGLSINTVGECDPSFTYGKCFGYGIRLNYWEP